MLGNSFNFGGQGSGCLHCIMPVATASAWGVISSDRLPGTARQLPILPRRTLLAIETRLTLFTRRP